MHTRNGCFDIDSICLTRKISGQQLDTIDAKYISDFCHKQYSLQFMLEELKRQRNQNACL